MNNQRNEWRALAEQIAEKVQEYIDEVDAWEEIPFLWVDGNTSEVNLGLAAEEFPGEKNNISLFVAGEGGGALFPDFDRIEEYVAGWFDLRQ